MVPVLCSSASFSVFVFCSGIEKKKVQTNPDLAKEIGLQHDRLCEAKAELDAIRKKSLAILPNDESAKKYRLPGILDDVGRELSDSMSNVKMVKEKRGSYQRKREIDEVGSKLEEMLTTRENGDFCGDSVAERLKKRKAVSSKRSKKKAKPSCYEIRQSLGRKVKNFLWP